MKQNPIAQFRGIYPAVSSHTMLYMLETFGASVKLTSHYSPDSLRVQLWTNALNKFNSEGNWHSIDLSYQDRESQHFYIFQGSFKPY